MSYRPLLLLLGVSALLVLPHSASSRLKIKLDNKVQFQPYKIAIPDFKNAGTGGAALGKKIAKILRNDLALTGLFRVIPPSAYLEAPPKNGIEPGSFDLAAWRKIQAEGLLKGSFRDEGNALRLKFRFYEMGSGKLTLKEEYSVPQNNLKWYLHLFAGKIYKFLTNEKGFFTTKIACVRNYRGKQEVWIMDFDGNGARKLTNNGAINALPAWSPNGKYIAYTSWKSRNPDLYVHNISTGKGRKISKFKGLNTGAAWSPNSQLIAYSASRGEPGMDIYLVNRDGSGHRRLTRSKHWTRNLSPSWSPDGKQIAFVSTRYSNPQIFVMNADGSGVRQLTRKGKYNQSPKWSPRGDWILFTGRDERNVFDLFLVSPKNGAIKRLTQNQGNNLEASWSPNGRNIVLSSTRNGVQKLFIMTWEGKNARQITFSAGQFITPTWSPPLVK